MFHYIILISSFRLKCIFERRSPIRSNKFFRDFRSKIFKRKKLASYNPDSFIWTPRDIEKGSKNIPVDIEYDRGRPSYITASIGNKERNTCPFSRDRDYLVEKDIPKRRRFKDKVRNFFDRVRINRRGNKNLNRDSRINTFEREYNTEYDTDRDYWPRRNNDFNINIQLLSESKFNNRRDQRNNNQEPRLAGEYPGMNPDMQNGQGQGGMQNGQGPGGMNPDMQNNGQGPGGMNPDMQNGQGFGGMQNGQGPGGMNPGMQNGQGPGGMNPDMQNNGQGPGGMNPDMQNNGQGPGGMNPDMQNNGQGPGGMNPDMQNGQGPGGMQNGQGPGGMNRRSMHNNGNQTKNENFDEMNDVETFNDNPNKFQGVDDEFGSIKNNRPLLRNDIEDPPVKNMPHTRRAGITGEPRYFDKSRLGTPQITSKYEEVREYLVPENEMKNFVRR